MRLTSVTPKFSSRLRGIFSPSIKPEIRNPSGNWSAYFGQWEGQKKEWIDTNCCWSYAGNEVLEDQLEFLMKTGRFSTDDIKWFKDNGYIDEDGDFYLSRRFIPIISGVRDNGNDEAEFWRLTLKYGAIPSKILPYTMMSGYFDKSAITPEMYALGKAFLQRVNIRYEELGTRFSQRSVEMIKGALLQGELQIGIPVPLFGWNQEKIDWDGKKQAEHSVALYWYEEGSEYPYHIYDQYNPMRKRLSKDFFIPIITRVVVEAKVEAKPNPVSQTTLGAQIWLAIAKFFQDNPLWTK